MGSYSELEMLVIRWSEARGIIPHSSVPAQYKKACEELDELGQAIDWGDESGIKDAVGDLIVCLINLCALQNINLTDCLAFAYDQIKDRKGHMNKEGIFVKEST